MEFADEEATGRDVVQLRYMDFQYTNVGYYHLSAFADHAGGQTVECDVDAWAGEVVENGKPRSLPPMDYEALNASAWSFAPPSTAAGARASTLRSPQGQAIRPMRHNYAAQRKDTSTPSASRAGSGCRNAVVDYAFFVEENDAEWAGFERALRAKGFRTRR